MMMTERRQNEERARMTANWARMAEGLDLDAQAAESRGDYSRASKLLEASKEARENAQSHRGAR